jgi:hypothetical protein
VCALDVLIVSRELSGISDLAVYCGLLRALPRADDLEDSSDFASSLNHTIRFERVGIKPCATICVAARTACSEL